MSMDKPLLKCRLCGNQNLSVLIDLGSQPIAHRLLEQPEREFTHSLKLHFCDQCGLNQILDPIDPEILYKGYNYCFSSWKPEPHREKELDLINSHKSRAKVFEIGCNDGLFLEELEKRGQELCVGLEPNAFAARIARETRGLKVYETFLDEQTVREIKNAFGLFDVVLARQVLEHVPGKLFLISESGGQVKQDNMKIKVSYRYWHLFIYSISVFWYC